MRIGEYETHPAADVFPLMEGTDLDGLIDDIKVNGQISPIWKYEGQILDGRNRLQATIALGIEPRIKDYTGEDPIGFAVSMNIARRHLDESQRAMVATRLANMPNGGDRKSERKSALRSPTQEQAAKMLNVGERTVQLAKSIIDKAEPEIVKAVDAGTISVNAGAELAKQPKVEQRKAIERGLDVKPEKPVVRAETDAGRQLASLIQGVVESKGGHVKHVNSRAMSSSMQVRFKGATFLLEFAEVAQ